MLKTPRIEPLISTDDREVVRIDAPCIHPKCPPGECRMYSAETMTITDADRAKAAELVAEGWWSTSAKRRTISRWKERVPTIEELFRPEALATFHGQRLAHFVREKMQYHQYGECQVGNWAEEHHEHAVLTPSLYRAFKQAGGDCAR